MAAARANAARAGVEHLIEWQCCAFASHPLLQQSANDTALAIVTNPPFGMRLSNAQPLTPLYQKLGHIVKVSVSNAIA